MARGEEKILQSKHLQAVQLWNMKEEDTAFWAAPCCANWATPSWESWGTRVSAFLAGLWGPHPGALCCGLIAALCFGIASCAEPSCSCLWTPMMLPLRRSSPGMVQSARSKSLKMCWDSQALFYKLLWLREFFENPFRFIVAKRSTPRYTKYTIDCYAPKFAKCQKTFNLNKIFVSCALH